MSKKTNGSKGRKLKATTIALIVGLIVIVVIVIILIVNAVRGNSPAQNTPAFTNTQEMEDILPYGDPESESYDFEGDYFDMATQKGTMTITRGSGIYNINITYSESDDSMSIWSMTASYDNNRRALFYSDCVRTDYVFSNMDEVNVDELSEETESTAADTTETQIEELNTDAEAETEAPEVTEAADDGVIKNEIYNQGTGFFYLSGDSIYWTDNKEDMGVGLMFQKVEATE